jgi:hypothetical protein
MSDTQASFCKVTRQLLLQNKTILMGEGFDTMKIYANSHPNLYYIEVTIAALTVIDTYMYAATVRPPHF